MSFEISESLAICNSPILVIVNSITSYPNSQIFPPIICFNEVFNLHGFGLRGYGRVPVYWLNRIHIYIYLQRAAGRF